jgi:hypothetical protein
LYEWNDDGTDALPVDGAGAQCERCHTPHTGTLRALSVSQLNRDFQGSGQIARLLEVGVLEQPTPEASTVPAFPRIDDERASSEERARIYLDVNCSSCHQPGGSSGAAHFDLRHTTPLALAGLCDAIPQLPLLGHDDARLIAPGKPQASILSIRLHAIDLTAMPPGRHSVDPAGTRVVDAWIASLDRCPPRGS